MNRESDEPVNLPDYLLGMLDALIALALAFVRVGVVTREQLAEAVETAMAQQAQQPINTASRRVPLEVLRVFFAAPVVGSGESEAQRRRAGLRVIESHDEPPAA